MGSRPGLSMPTIRRMKAKLALMGEGGVGKTSLIRRFVLNEYKDNYFQTFGTQGSKVELTFPPGATTEVRLDRWTLAILGQRGSRDLSGGTNSIGSRALMA